MNESLSPSCIYTIRATDYLAADHASGGGGEFTERRPWVGGLRILQKARKSQERVPVLFAPAEGSISAGLIYWALIDDIALTPQGTKVRFSALQPFSKKPRLSSLKKLSDGEPLSDDYIRPYVPCHTPAYLSTLAASTTLTVLVPDIEDEELSAPEGALSFRQHLHRERNPEIVAAKRRQVLAVAGRLACSVCTFDFRQFYGKLGSEVCEVHHLRPLAEADGEVQTRLDDLAIVCANCHRMLHRSRPFLTLEQLNFNIRNASSEAK